MWGSPRLEVLHALVSRGMDLRIDESVMATLRGLLQRAQDWSSTAHHELSKPEPAVFDMPLLTKLKEEALTIPVRIPEDRRVTAVIEDGGGRYCLCRGASDGGFMIGCDFCEEWFHGKCVNVATAKGEQMVASGASFECPTCAQKRGVPYAFPDALPGSDEDDEEVDEEDQAEKAEKKVWLAKLWPPSRLLDMGGVPPPPPHHQMHPGHHMPNGPDMRGMPPEHMMHHDMHGYDARGGPGGPRGPGGPGGEMMHPMHGGPRGPHQGAMPGAHGMHHDGRHMGGPGIGYPQHGGHGYPGQHGRAPGGDGMAAVHEKYLSEQQAQAAGMHRDPRYSGQMGGPMPPPMPPPMHHEMADGWHGGHQRHLQGGYGMPGPGGRMEQMNGMHGYPGGPGGPNGSGYPMGGPNGMNGGMHGRYHMGGGDQPRPPPPSQPDHAEPPPSSGAGAASAGGDGGGDGGSTGAAEEGNGKRLREEESAAGAPAGDDDAKRSRVE